MRKALRLIIVVCLLCTISVALADDLFAQAIADEYWWGDLSFEEHLDYWWRDLLENPEDNCRTLAEGYESYWYDVPITFDELQALTIRPEEVLYRSDLLEVTLKETFCRAGILLMCFEIRLLSEGIPYTIADLRQELTGQVEFPEGAVVVDLFPTMHDQPFWYDPLGVSEDRMSIFLGFLVEYTESDLSDDGRLELTCNLLTGRFENGQWNDTLCSVGMSVRVPDDEQTNGAGT